jgi:hypothetical protein
VAPIFALVALMMGCSEPLSMEIEASLTEGRVPLSVTFDINTENIDEVRWDFDDGTTLTTDPLDGPVDHTFTRSGTLRVRVVGVQDEGDSQRTAPVSLTITTIPGPLDSLTVEPTAPTIAAAGDLTFNAVARDEFGNGIPNVTLSFESLPSVGEFDQPGQFVAGTVAGTYASAVTVHARQGDNSRTVTADVLIVPLELARVSFNTTTFTATAAQAFDVEATAFDQYGNALDGIALEYKLADGSGQQQDTDTFIASAKTAEHKSALTVIATQHELTAEARANLIILPDSLQRVELTPTDASVEVGGQVNFEAFAFDGFDNPIPEAVVEYSSDTDAGTVGSQGVFQAGNRAGTYEAALAATVTRNLESLQAKSDVTILPGPLETVIFEPELASVTAGEQLQLVATGMDSHGNEISNLELDYAIEPNAGQIDGSGNVTGGEIAGVYPDAITLVASHGTVTKEFSTGLEVKPGPLHSVAISLPDTSVAVGETIPIAPAALDRFGNRITLRPDGVGDYTNIPIETGCVNHWECVDEASADDDTTHILDNTGAFPKDAFSLQNSALPPSTPIGSVTIHWRGACDGATCDSQPHLRLSGSETAGSVQGMTGSYADFSETLARPGGGNWSVADLNNLQAVIGLDVQTANAKATQVYVVANYDPRDR